ncbi:MAG: response regulator transcription factor [Oscillospiraceae bacterium]|nr:response regulator transcription factor [Oscillospiraceae bacterium]
MPKKILILEDEASIRSFVVINLKRGGYEVVEAATGAAALAAVAEHPDIQLALLDLMLPDMDGFEVCRAIHAARPHMGIIMLTARSGEVDKVTGLMTGADDYMTKPFSPTELLARIDAVYRRLGQETQSSTEIVSGPFLLNIATRMLYKRGREIKLTQVEYAMMKLFLDNPNAALSREMLLEKVWEKEHSDLKIVDVNVRRLRIKVEDDSNNPRHITTVWGYGYKWEM